MDITLTTPAPSIRELQISVGALALHLGVLEDEERQAQT